MEKERGMKEYYATPALQEFPQLSWLPFFSPQNQGVIADYLAYLRARHYGPAMQEATIRALKSFAVLMPYGQKTRTRLDRGSYDPAIAAPRLDFNCAMPHIYRQCARKRWRGTDAWIGRPCWCTSQGRSIKSCCYATSIWSRTIVSSATSSQGASG